MFSIARIIRSLVLTSLSAATLYPFIAAADVYIRGTDDVLWKIDDVGHGTRLGGFKSKSTPVVLGGFVYFQGTDNKFWRVATDGSAGAQVGGGYTTSASPFVAEYIFFRGTDDKLWRVNLDGSGGVNLGGYKSKSTPVASGRFVFFQGTDDKLWRINIDGSGGINLGLNTTSSAPFPTGDYVYFRGTDDRLLRTNLEGSSGNQISGYKTKSTPFVTDQYIFFQGTDDKLWRTALDGSKGIVLGGGYKTKSAPIVDQMHGYVYFQGTDDDLWRVNIDGSHGVNLGGFKTASTPGIDWAAIAKPRPKYIVMTLLYAPPGTNGGKSSSQVEYGNGSSTGTTLSIGSSFKLGVNATLTSGGAKSSGGGGGGGGGDTPSFGLSSTWSDSSGSSLAVKKSQSNDIKVPGPSADGINHDEDEFVLWLNPQFSVSVDPQRNLDWDLGVSGPTMIIQKVFVGWLRNPKTMPPGLAQQLASALLTEADYKEIMKLDPFAEGGTAIDPNRFISLPYSFPYLPPQNQADSPSTSTYAVTGATNYDSHSDSSTSYGVALNAALDVLKVGTSLDITNTRSTTTENSASQSASVTVGDPAFGYSSPNVDILVYWDSIYNSFMFAFTSGSAALSGSVVDKMGKPATHAPVTLQAGKQTFHTFTDTKGEYRVYNAPHGAYTLTVHGETFPVALEGEKNKEAGSVKLKNH